MAHPSRSAIITAYRDAAKALTLGVAGQECCGLRIDRDTGQCLRRPNHPTAAHVAIHEYPGHYDRDGHFIHNLGEIHDVNHRADSVR